MPAWALEALPRAKRLAMPWVITANYASRADLFSPRSNTQAAGRSQHWWLTRKKANETAAVQPFWLIGKDRPTASQYHLINVSAGGIGSCEAGRSLYHAQEGVSTRPNEGSTGVGRD